VTGRRGRKRRKLLYDLKERIGYSHLKEEALDRTMWRARFGRGLGPVLRQTTKWMNEVRFLFWFTDRQRNEMTCCTDSFSELKTPTTCATILIVFLAYYNEVQIIVAQLVNKSIAFKNTDIHCCIHNTGASLWPCVKLYVGLSQFIRWVVVQSRLYFQLDTRFRFSTFTFTLCTCIWSSFSPSATWGRCTLVL
jgi:hypothetical protein